MKVGRDRSSRRRGVTSFECEGSRPERGDSEIAYPRLLSSSLCCVCQFEDRRSSRERGALRCVAQVEKSCASAFTLGLARSSTDAKKASLKTSDIDSMKKNDRERSVRFLGKGVSESIGSEGKKM